MMNAGGCWQRHDEMPHAHRDASGPGMSCAHRQAAVPGHGTCVLDREDIMSTSPLRRQAAAADGTGQRPREPAGDRRFRGGTHRVAGHAWRRRPAELGASRAAWVRLPAPWQAGASPGPGRPASPAADVAVISRYGPMLTAKRAGP